ncbi:hypothetical protein L0F63_006516 [Massospora cicadina]|nr:hypothetical protein L0F63_006516 [Massospora cicadina]
MSSEFIQRGRTLRRGKTLTRPERFQVPEPMLNGQAERKSLDAWVVFSRVVTFWAPSFVLRKLGFPHDDIIQAWREKIALCFIISLICATVAFLTLGLPYAFCPESLRQDVGDRLMAIGPASGSKLSPPGYYIVNQGIYFSTNPSYFRRPAGYDRACTKISLPRNVKFEAVEFDPCSAENGNDGCRFEPIAQVADQLNLQLRSKAGKPLRAGYSWKEVKPGFTVIDGQVLDFTTYLTANPSPIPNDALDEAIRRTARPGGRDATWLMHRDKNLLAAVPCLWQKYGTGRLQKSAAGCFGVDFFMTVSLVVILGIIAVRFAMAFVFHWMISHRLSRRPRNAAQQLPRPRRLMDDPNELFTILLSLAGTDYSDDKKLLFIVADGIITGSGNDRSTPDLCVEMLELDPQLPTEPQSYIAVAAGHKQHNRAQVYAGHFNYKAHRVPTLVVVKCGNLDEAGKPKAGNRGKRDSQLILMNFFSRVVHNERMTPLDYDLFCKVQHLMGVTPDNFETVLMVDADTKVYPDALKLLTYCLINDPLVMGLCGETKIANKRDSWVTGIQVFEYYISHHLGKGFESVFGGVTCLPGCFCMYRLKAPKGDRDWVPIITKPEIVQEYSQNVVETLHQKNLLLLGEDRFLTTLMLRNFPNRKMMFVPQAVCKTVVPDEFSVLLSQRRRWINSTIHNLLELVLVRNLCGTFCFSMQFVIFMELIGTVVLPVAIIMTFVLIINVSQSQINSLASSMPLVMLLAVLVSPALLILITSRKLIYVAWMAVYLAALPVWNFVLPVYSYWHFDDFSWGATRMVEGEAKGEAHGGKEGSFDASKVSLRRWEDYERRRRRSARKRERAAKLDTSNDSDSQYALLNDSSDNPYGNDYHSAHSDTTEFDLPQSNYQYHNNYRPPPKGFYN